MSDREFMHVRARLRELTHLPIAVRVTNMSMLDAFRLDTQAARNTGLKTSSRAQRTLILKILEGLSCGTETRLHLYLQKLPELPPKSTKCHKQPKHAGAEDEAEHRGYVADVPWKTSSISSSSSLGRPLNGDAARPAFSHQKTLVYMGSCDKRKTYGSVHRPQLGSDKKKPSFNRACICIYLETIENQLDDILVAHCEALCDARASPHRFRLIGTRGASLSV
eukprot:1036555-Prorocentrum_minimum.AAC.2